jgi:alkanesulfonate monooxygenase SsuD/methylene tetrahydromethanopterin reductase-like flavin-dependent oxidoreductase (luciferase family)
VASRSAWVGSPEQIVAQIRDYHAEVGGFEHASLQVNFNTIGRAEAEASMRLFAREVMSRFRPPSGSHHATP